MGDLDSVCKYGSCRSCGAADWICLLFIIPLSTFVLRLLSLLVNKIKAYVLLVVLDCMYCYTSICTLSTG